MALKLTNFGKSQGLTSRLTARVTRSLVTDETSKHDQAFVLTALEDIPDLSILNNYAAILTSFPLSTEEFRSVRVPIISCSFTEKLLEDYIVAIEPATGFIRIVYRPESPHNTIFTTDRCNSNCLMCSQPPKDVDDSDLIAEHLRLISLVKSPPKVLGITGGEPTLLGQDLVRLIDNLKIKFPQTYVHMLTNGRLYRDENFTNSLANVGHPAFVSAIPLYADIPGIHDYIVQAHGAFDETMEGLYNAENAGLTTEIRVVLHKQSIPRLKQLAEFIYRNLPFSCHIALMGLEHMGYVKKNWELLWIDPFDYVPDLESAVRYLHLRGMNVSIYNLQLCLLPKSLWAFARKSISDFKNVYPDICTDCSVNEHCCGFFQSQPSTQSAHIHPL